MATRIALAIAVAVISRVNRMRENRSHGIVRCFSPFQLIRSRRPNSNFDPLFLQVATYFANRSQAIKLIEDQTNDILSLLIGIDHDFILGYFQISDGHPEEDLSPL